MNSQEPGQPPSPSPGVFVPPPGPPRPLPPRRIILEQPLGGMRKVLLSLLVVALVFSLIFNVSLLGAYRKYVQTDPKVEELLHSGSEKANEKIAIITIRGMITEDPDGFVMNQIEHVSKDKNVKAVVLRVESPGGTVTGSEYTLHHLKKLRDTKEIPLVVSMGGLAASGGYYVSMAVGRTDDTIYAEPATWTGSIGVIIPHYDISELITRLNIKDDSVASGPLKQMLSPTRAPTQEEKAVVRELVDESFARFKEVVAEGRPRLAKDAELMTKATTGQVFSAAQAKALGLVDRYGYIDDAVERAAELAGLDAKKACVVEFKKPQGFLDKAFGGPAASESAYGLSAVLELTVPRAYYLCTWLPTAIRSGP